MNRKIIVGLGNPGRQYIRTRHNLGFWTTDLLAQHFESSFKTSSRQKAYLAETHYATWKITLAKPMTYMNLSGQAVSLLLKFYQTRPEDLLVICDDVNLPVGTIRLRKSGSPGGHHGLESIVESIDSTAFPRLRIGIKPIDYELPEDLTHFVLQPFNKGEEAVAAESVKRAVLATLTLLDENIEAAMNAFNA